MSTREQLNEALEDPAPCEIFYFYCHGIAGATGTQLAIDVAAEIEEAARALDDAQREPWDRLLGQLRGRSGEARLFAADQVDISEGELRDLNFFAEERRPFVFLNMCHSAGMLPGTRAGLPAVFLDRAASAVIGTEAPVTAQFADAFAQRLLPALLRGERLGRAMLEARRDFHGQRNPLALLYTLYGRGDTRVVDRTAPPAPTTSRGEEG